MQKHENILMVVSDSWFEIDWQSGTEEPNSNSDVFIASRAHIAHETLTTTKMESIKGFWKKSMKFICHLENGQARNKRIENVLMFKY